MNDIQDVIPREVLSLATGLVVVSSVVASFFYVRSRCFPSVEQQLLREANARNTLLADAFSKYRVLLEKINSDREVIIQHLRDFNQEVSFIKKNQDKQDQSVIKSYQSMATIAYSPVQNELALMRADLHVLMNTYPLSPIDISMTLVEINDAYDALKLHHSNVETIAENFLPNLQALLNESKLNTRNFSC